ncbi:MAG: small subunit ribosomal protein S15 [Candidatus Woesearchaeota archaeon]|jgi:small subunit ribosomal protein S15
MAKKYSRSKGQSGSTKPYVKENPAWMTHKDKEVEALVVKYVKEKLTAAQVGIKLRDQYGIPSIKIATGKTVTQILTEKKLTKSLPQDLIDCIAKFIAVTKHYETNKQDKTSFRGRQLAVSRISRLVKYYKETGKIANTWKFDPNRAGMYLE